MYNRIIRAKNSQYYRKAKDAGWKCLREGCEEEVTACHVLQENGVLDKIAKDSHVYRILPKGAEKKIEFKKIGISKAGSSKTLCNKHDRGIFRPIEHEKCSWNNYNQFILQSYKGLLHEIRTIDEIILSSEKNIEDEFSSRFVDPRKVETNRRKWNSRRELLFEYKELIERDIERNEENFRFHVFEVPGDSLPIALSSVFQYFSLDHDFDGLSNVSNPPLVFFNVIPTEDYTKIFIGYKIKSEEKVSQNLKSLSVVSCSRFYDIINDLVFKFTGVWFVSHDFYISRIQPMESEISDYMVSRYDSKQRLRLKNEIKKKHTFVNMEDSGYEALAEILCRGKELGFRIFSES